MAVDHPKSRVIPIFPFVDSAGGIERKRQAHLPCHDFVNPDARNEWIVPRHTIQRCQVHKARNITERLAKPLHASVRKALRQAWELDDADKAERLIKNLARRLEHDAPGVAASIQEGLDEILTVTRLGLPVELRRSLACTNIIENMNGTIRQVCRNVKRWRDAKMALRWTGAAMLEAAKGFRRLKAHKQLPILRAALAAHQASHSINPDLEQKAKAA